MSKLGVWEKSRIHSGSSTTTVSPALSVKGNPTTVAAVDTDIASTAGARLLMSDSTNTSLLFGLAQTGSLGNSIVTNVKLAKMAANTIKGNNTAGLQTPADLNASQVNAMLGTITTSTSAFGDLSGTYPGPQLAGNIGTNVTWTGQQTYQGLSVFTPNAPILAFGGQVWFDSGTQRWSATPDAITIQTYMIQGDGAAGDLTGTYPSPTIASHAVTNAKAAQMAAKTLKGNNTASLANAADLTLDLCRAVLDPADYASSTAGTITYTATLSPVPAAYTAGQQYTVVFSNTNTAVNPSLNLNSLGNKFLKKDGALLGIGQLRANACHTVTYDGADLQITSPLPGPVLLAHITGVNLKTVAATPLYTVPAGRTCLVTAALVNCTAANTITTAATAGVGVAAGSADIYAQVVMTGLTLTTKAWGWSTQGLIVNVVAASVINFGVSVAATGTSQTADVMLFGYLY